ncbi:MAG: MBL fold metallo-hydrolase [Candidatus Zixiibacteriota bacterium]|nr:MAG: MBL fold metallo-hydrolase [candidate division Zixibacteria bacterium]
MILEHFLLSVNETNCYVLGCRESGQAAIIDPGEWNEQLAAFLRDQKLTPRVVLLTHGHTDHTGGVSDLKRSASATVAAHPDNPLVEKPLRQGNVVEVGTLKLKVVEVPGHTEDSLAFAIGSEVFAGDALFAGSVGGTPDREAFERLTRSIREKLFSLGDDMVIHPGHGPATTVLIERVFNPFLMA